MPLFTDYSLRHHNTFGIDVKSRYFLSAISGSEIRDFFGTDIFRNNKHMILGGGSNILFTSDFDGIVIHLANKGIELIDETDEHVFVRSAAGENWDDLVAFCVENNFGGIENLSLIPGFAGAAPVQNIGAYGSELRDVFHSAEVLELESGKTGFFDRQKCRFGYRDSVFKRELKNRAVVLNLTLRLYKNPEINLSYKELNNRLSGIQNPGIADVRETVIAIRAEKLPDPEVVPNAGSFFKNPVIGAEQFRKLIIDFPGLVNYPSDDGKVKLAAGQLIDLCGWKDFQDAKVAVHPRQALVIINKNHASGEEIVEFSKRIQSSVFDRFDVMLEPEVNII